MMNWFEDVVFVLGDDLRRERDMSRQRDGLYMFF